MIDTLFLSNSEYSTSTARMKYELTSLLALRQEASRFCRWTSESEHCKFESFVPLLSSKASWSIDEWFAGSRKSSADITVTMEPHGASWGLRSHVSGQHGLALAQW